MLRHVTSFNAVHNEAAFAGCSCREHHGIYMSHPYALRFKSSGGGSTRELGSQPSVSGSSFMLSNEEWVTSSCWDETPQPGNVNHKWKHIVSNKICLCHMCRGWFHFLSRSMWTLAKHILHHSRVTISFYSTLPTGLIHCFMQSILYINLMICLKVLETLYIGTALLYNWDIFWFSRITYYIVSNIKFSG